MQPNKSLIDHMRETAPSLNKAERRVADIVLADIEAATRMTTKDLSQRAAVSEPTIVRFARRMGGSGFTDFKMRLSQDFATGRMFVLPERGALPQDAATIATQVYEATAQALAYSFAQRDPGALAAAAAAIHTARRVFCFGVGGSSANVASEAENRLFRFDVSAGAIIDPYRQLIAAALCEAGDVLLMFSVTGKPSSLLESARLARDHGATIISVTRPTSPLAAESTIVIALDIPDDDRRVEIPNRSRYGQLYILDCIATLLAAKRLASAGPKLHRARNALLALQGKTTQQPIGD
jgi:RpiR family carbohydrate utilization transcriptional regulator